MLRLWDWECTVCNTRQEHLTPVPAGETTPQRSVFPCVFCGGDTEQQRLISIPAEYHGEKALNPIVKGGSFDTAGYKAVPDLPECPGQAEAQAKASAAIAALPLTATREEIRHAALSATDGCRPTLADYAAHFNKPEWKEAEKQRKHIAKENKEKRKRLKALRRGENVNFRKDKCKGDPKLT